MRGKGEPGKWKACVLGPCERWRNGLDRVKRRTHLFGIGVSYGVGRVFESWGVGGEWERFGQGFFGLCFIKRRAMESTGAHASIRPKIYQITISLFVFCFMSLPPMLTDQLVSDLVRLYVLCLSPPCNLENDE